MTIPKQAMLSFSLAVTILIDVVGDFVLVRAFVLVELLFFILLRIASS